MDKNSMYIPYADRTPDSQYQNLLSKILAHGRIIDCIQGGESRMLCGHEMRFRMENGFPIISERDMSGNFFKGALAEHIGFLNGARTHEELVKWGCPWWKNWVTTEKCAHFGLEPGDLGPGSYGPGWTRVPMPNGESFNQIEALVRKTKVAAEKGLSLRTIEISPWISFYVIGKKRQVVVAPCHGWIHVHVFPRERELVIEHRQRSADSPVGLAFNIIQYAAFGLMLEYLTGYKFSELVYWITDAHLYEEWTENGEKKNQLPYVNEMLAREPRRFPRVWIEAEGIKSITDFRPEHFKFDEYDPHPKILIPTPI